MPRVVLLVTDPDVTVHQVAAQVSDWTGERLDLALVSLHPVEDVDVLEPATPWAHPVEADPGAEPWTLRGWSYGEVPAPTAPPPASSRARRLQEEALVRERSHRLWDLVAADAQLGPLLESADAVAAVDAGGIRSAFHLARRHSIPVATNGLVPALVELAAAPAH